jgi:hypothetical protein
VDILRTTGDDARYLALSDALDAAEDHALAMWGDGYRAGAAGAFAAGYAAAVADVKAADHALHDHLRALPTEAERWAVRGEPRTRATFGQPHRDDHPGRSA